MSINRVVLTGRLAREVEFKTLPSGAGVVNNAIAVSHWRKDNNGQGQEHTSFIDVSFFGRTAEVVHQYLRKGSLVGVDGRLEQQSWKDAQSGQNRSKLVVIVDQMQMLESKNAQSGSGGSEYGNSAPQQPRNQQPSYSNYQQGYGGGSNQGQFNQQIDYGTTDVNDLPF